MGHAYMEDYVNGSSPAKGCEDLLAFTKHVCNPLGLIERTRLVVTWPSILCVRAAICCWHVHEARSPTISNAAVGG
jgi:hypothetical protein